MPLEAVVEAPSVITSIAVPAVREYAPAGITAGDAFAAVAPTAANSLTAGIAIEVITDGASTTASKGIVCISYKRVN